MREQAAAAGVEMPDQVGGIASGALSPDETFARVLAAKRRIEAQMRRRRN